MAVLADDDVVVHNDVERPGGRDDRLRHLDVRTGRGRVAGRMIVHEYDSRRRKLQRTSRNFARIGWGVVYRPNLLNLISDERVFLVEEQDPEILTNFEGHCRVAIVEDLLPRS